MSEDRLRELEIKISFLENHVAQQDRAMMELTRALDRAERSLNRLAESVKSGDAAGPSGPASPGDERPPHY